MGAYDKLISQVRFWDARLTRAGVRMGLKPFPTIYELVSDEQMVRLIPYVMMPTHYRHWSFGKKYEQFAKNRSFHIFEAVINSNPSHCYLGVTNEMLMQLLVMAHAKWGHVDFFANNKLFAESQPESLDARMAQHAEFIKRLVENPLYGWEKVEYVLDAAHAIDEYCGWLPTVKDAAVDKEERDKLEARLVELQLKLPKLVSEFEKEGVKAEIKEIEEQLKKVPLRPSDDILGFLMDPKRNPRLTDEARGMLAIVRDQARYFQPQGRTKIMNEGWASYWEKQLLIQPEVDMPFEWHLDAGRFWSMHTKVATNVYFDPYALGLAVFEYIDRKYGYDEGEQEVEVEEGKWYRVLTDEDMSLTDRDKPGSTAFITEDEVERVGAEATAKGHTWFEADTGLFWRGYGTTKKVKVAKRNRDKMLHVRQQYEDTSFLREFLTDELFEELNQRSLDWVRRVMEIIGRMLLKNGWAPELVVDPLPNDLEGLMQIVQRWLDIAELSQQMRTDMGNPLFPAPAETLKTMATILQIVAAYDEDKTRAKQMLVLRAGYSMVPPIKVVDDGTFSDGSLTLLHVFDETFGPLMQSECRDTVRYTRRLWGRPVRLITKEVRTDRFGRPIGEPVPYEYYCDEDGEVKERWLE